MLHTHGGVLGARRLLPRAVPEVRKPLLHRRQNRAPLKLPLSIACSAPAFRNSTLSSWL